MVTDLEYRIKNINVTEKLPCTELKELKSVLNTRNAASTRTVSVSDIE